MAEVYTHGHHESVLRSHTWRTAANSAGYLLDSLEPGQRLLDVGCGPGNITIELAERVSPGEVVGVDRSADVVAQAVAAAEKSGVANISFAVADIYELEYPDGSFDVVHAHQVMQHLTNPVAALVEMRRVLKPGGLMAVRESDYGSFAWAPANDGLDRWMELYHQVTARNEAEANAGRYLSGWVSEAGFTDITASSSTWTFHEPADRLWWGDVWAERVEQSGLAEQAIRYGLADGAELGVIAEGWRTWAREEVGLFLVLHGEVLARR